MINIDRFSSLICFLNNVRGSLSTNFSGVLNEWLNRKIALVVYFENPWIFKKPWSLRLAIYFPATNSQMQSNTCIKISQHLATSLLIIYKPYMIETKAQHASSAHRGASPGTTATENPSSTPPTKRPFTYFARRKSRAAERHGVALRRRQQRITLSRLNRHDFTVSLTVFSSLSCNCSARGASSITPSNCAQRLTFPGPIYTLCRKWPSLLPFFSSPPSCTASARCSCSRARKLKHGRRASRHTICGVKVSVMP